MTDALIHCNYTAAVAKIENRYYNDNRRQIRLSASAEERDDEYLGLPPIAANEPILCLIWEQVAILLSGCSIEEHSDAAASLVSLARDDDRYGKLILEEGGVPPLLKLLKEGRLDGQENAARAIGLLGKDPESVEHVVNCGVCSGFAKVLKEGHMKVQIVVAWAISELAAHHPKCQDHFAQNNAIRLLVSHLAFETIQEHSKYTIPNKQNMSSIHSILMATNNDNNNNSLLDSNNNKGIHEDDYNINNKVAVAHPGSQTSSQMHNVIANKLAIKGNNKDSKEDNNAIVKHNNNNVNSNSHTANVSIAGTSIKGREYEDSGTKAQMKAMAARALWQLCRGNVTICHTITESTALLCFAESFWCIIISNKGTHDVQHYSAMALMEITSVAEEHAELRRSAFKPTSPAAKAVVEQFFKVVGKGDSDDFLIPCVKAVGNLARTFRATETRFIGPLVKLLDEREPHISMEAANALIKFAETDNYLHETHCNAIIEAGGAKHLIQLVYFGEQMVQIPSLLLLCFVSLHVPKSETLGQEEVLIVLEWCTKQGHLMAESRIEAILPEAKSRLELYQSRGTRGFH
ncbi:uncharacterized protein [Cicer arietinum]|uniref:Uncharacterized protein LOC101505159 n=1 Tax=Cicer arietinum TaxID=3827 RepID=A0A1S2YMI0_CICAR|nr:uncharacterized protein LOC101505159 [Cicer arietinum]